MVQPTQNIQPEQGQQPPVVEKPQQNSMGISPRTLFLIIALACCAVFFFIIAVYTQPQKQHIVQNNLPTPTPDVAHSTLALELATPAGSQSATSTTGGTVNVTINTGTNPVTAAQIELSYDPTILTNIALSPGTFFKTPVQLIKKIDQANGRISYALGIQPQDKGVIGSGTVATISYDILPNKETQTIISFLPKTIVTAQGINQTVLKSTTDLTISLSPGGTAGASQVPTSAELSPTTLP